MHIIRINDVGKDFTYQWPSSGGKETFEYFIEYLARAEDGEHVVRVGFCKRFAYGKNRMRVVVWIDEYPHAEFLGGEDFEKSGDVLSEIKIPGKIGERICRFPEEPIPDRYAMFRIGGLPARVEGPKVHGAWAVVTNIANQKTMIALAALRRLERMR